MIIAWAAKSAMVTGSPSPSLSSEFPLFRIVDCIEFVRMLARWTAWEAISSSFENSIFAFREE